MFVSHARTSGVGRADRRMRSARPGELPSREQMDDLIRRESCRADRNGHEFCLVVFSVGTAAGRPRAAALSTHRLVRAMLRRARTTDVVGWFGDDQLCAVLPDTPPAGARVFAHSVCELVAGRMPRPRAVIYQYPGETSAPASDALVEGVLHRRLDDHSHHNGDGNGDGGGNGNGNGHSALYGRLNRKAGGNGTGNGNGHSNGNSNGNGYSNGNGHTRALDRALAGASCVIAERTVRLPQDALADAFAGQPATEPLGALMVRPMPRWKRALDVVGAAVGLVLLSPVMGLAALAILLSGGGPVLFTQRRAGLGGRPFTILKFRTMTADAEAHKAALRPLSERDGPAFKLSHDPRVTAVGRILRQTSIDELPQLWNVLRGEMSLVGPRPLPLDESDECARWQRHRLDVTPGLTCIWQISGRSTVSFAQWVRMDMAYIRRRTLLHDLWILIRTVPAVLIRRGAW